MRILFLTSELPYPPYAGAPLRNYGLIEGVSGQGYDIWLLSFAAPYPVPIEQTPLQRHCAHIATIPRPQRSIPARLRDLLLTRRADIERRYYSAAYARKLHDWLTAHDFDLIQIENLEMTAYLPLIKKLQPDVPVVYDAHNAEYALQQRIYETERGSLMQLPGALYSYIQIGRIRDLESRVCQTVDHVIAVSEADAELLGQLCAHTPITVIPNGVSTALYETPAEPVDLEDTALVFTGKMDYRPNVDAALWFAEAVLPLIRQEIPDAHFYIVGQSPHTRLDVLRGQPGITLTGFVPTVIPYLQATSVFVVPLRMGSGTRLKVLEAMAAACPIVSTRVGAQGLHVTDGQELMLADSAQDFARAVIHLQQDRESAAALGQRAHQFVRANYDWSVLLPRLLVVYKELGVARTN